MIASQRAAATRLPFYLLLLWLMLLPWPLGANRDWIWPWFVASLYAIAALAVWQGEGLERVRALPLAWKLAMACVLLILIGDVLRVWFGTVVVPGQSGVFLALADADAAQLGAWKLSAVPLLMWLLPTLSTSRRRARWLLTTLFLIGVLQAVLALSLALTQTTIHLFGHAIGGDALPSGSYINRNHFAGLLELSGAAGFGLLASGMMARAAAETWRERLRRFGHGLMGSRLMVRVGLALLVVALVMTRSRMGNAAFFIGLTTAGVAALIYWRPLPRVLIWMLLSIVAIDVLVLGAWVGVDKLADRVAETRLVATQSVSGENLDGAITADSLPLATHTEPSDAERVAVATAGLVLWRERPWFGHGAGSFRILFPSVKPESVGLFYEHAHNDYVQTLVERGVLGLMLVLIAVFGLLISAIATIRARSDGLACGLALASIAAFAAFAAHALVDFNLQIPANLYLWVACLSLGSVAALMPLPSSRRRSR